MNKKSGTSKDAADKLVKGIHRISSDGYPDLSKIERLTRGVYQRDYVTFGFGDRVRTRYSD